jgi:arsenate reductase
MMAGDTLADEAHAPLRVLFICTGNSARSQIAEALLRRKGRDRFEVGSAGARPAPAVHPNTIAVLSEYGIDWTAARPKGLDAVADRAWDLVITVCDRIKEDCPTFPGKPVFAHWGVPDPATISADAARRLAFRDAVQFLSRRIDLLLALPVERLERRALELRLEANNDEHTTDGHRPWLGESSP